jgi:hypothetical protein
MPCRPAGMSVGTRKLPLLLPLHLPHPPPLYFMPEQRRQRQRAAACLRAEQWRRHGHDGWAVAAGESGSAGAAAVWLCGRARPLGAASLNVTKWKQEEKWWVVQEGLVKWSVSGFAMELFPRILACCERREKPARRYWTTRAAF